MSYNSPFSGEQVDDAVSKRHEQNTDTKLDEGGANEVTAEEARDHIDATDNPHSVTKAQVGLGNVDNVSAADLRDRSTHTGTQTLATISDAGTAATADVTTSATDTTAGRLLKVGDFGLGNRRDAASFPIFTEAAFPNKPPHAQFMGVSEGFTGNGGAISIPSQFFDIESGDRGGILALQTSNNTIRTKTFSTGSWSDWNTYFHTGNLLGTVSQSAGVPTGAVIERGSNANGEFVKYADGTQIATRQYDATQDLIETQFVNSTGQRVVVFDPVSFPASVVSSQRVTHVEFAGSDDVGIRSNVVSTTLLRGRNLTSPGNWDRITIVLGSDDALPSTFTVRFLLTSIGRWY